MYVTGLLVATAVVVAILEWQITKIIQRLRVVEGQSTKAAGTAPAVDKLYEPMVSQVEAAKHPRTPSECVSTRAVDAVGCDPRDEAHQGAATS